MALDRMAASPRQDGPASRPRPAYRVKQFLASLRPAITAEEQRALAGWLPPDAGSLFAGMSPRDQRHSLNVVQTLLAGGADQPDLLAAALLHDVAKTVQPGGRRLRLRHRVLIVLLNAVNGQWVRRLADSEPESWRYPFYVHLNHPQMGAVLVERAGCTPLTTELVRRHQERLSAPPTSQAEALLLLLQAADDAN